MPTGSARPGSTIVATLRYRDVVTAIDWLCRAFGFEKRLVVNDDMGDLSYAELVFGNGMVMVGSIDDSTLGKFMTQPVDAGGAETQICYLFVADAVAHCARARAAGAEIMLDAEDPDSNGRGYSCRDPEGHIWNFGIYDPLRRRSGPDGDAGQGSASRRAMRRTGTVAAVLSHALTSAVVVGCVLGAIELSNRDLAAATINTAMADASDASLHERNDFAAVNARTKLNEERRAREDAERLLREVRDQLNQVRAARETAEHIALAGAQKVEVRQQLARTRSTAEAERRNAQQTLARLTQVEFRSKAAQDQLTVERAAKEAADLALRQAQQAREKLAQDRKAKKRS